MTNLFVCNTNQPSLTYGLLFLRLPNNHKVALFNLFCLGGFNEKKGFTPSPPISFDWPVLQAKLSTLGRDETDSPKTVWSQTELY